MSQELTPNNNPTRREFIRTASSAVLLAGAVGPHIALSPRSFAQNDSTLRVGLVGCGGRGTGAAAQAMRADKNVMLTAMGDAFGDAIEGSIGALKKEEGVGEKVNVEPDKKFVGLDAFQKVIDSGVDLVILTSPPGFRPQHLEAAIKAGKHVFCEKPMAVDGPGVRRVMAAAEEAKKKKLGLVAGFCWRYHFPKRATYERLLGGAIGDITTIYSTYNTGPVKAQTLTDPSWTPLQRQIRNWYQFAWLSGDHIVEQAIHSIDMMAWGMGDVPPARAMGTGGRQVRTSWGNIWDHFAIVYEYPNGARGFHFCRQQNGCDNDYAVKFSGRKGDCVIDCTRNIHSITGPNEWRSTERNVPDMYQVEHNELFASIRKGEPINDGKWMAYSTMTGIMGRMAAYTGKTVTWEEALNSQEVLAPAYTDWNTPVEVPPVPMPGRTKLI